MTSTFMLDLTALTLAIALPWIAGTLMVLALCRLTDAACWLRGAGYGYLLGAFAATLVMRLLSGVGVRWTLPAVAVPLLALALALAWPAHAFLAPRGLRERWTSVRQDFATHPAWLRGMFWVCLVLIAVRLASLALEIAWSLLLPWDAWSQWATKARVWFEFGRIAPFVSQQDWLVPGDPMRFVDMHPQYPATVPLLQVWTDLWLGRWDESLMNAPWLAVACALGLAFYAQLRRAGETAPKAMLYTYLLLSLPFLDIHVALAGTADLFVAAAYAMAAMALWQWARSRERSDLVLAAAMTLILTTIKVEGLLWALTLAPPAIVAVHRRAGFMVLAALGAAAVGYLALGPAELSLFGYTLQTRFIDISLPLAQHLFVMDNWHLLWYAAPAVVAVRYRRLLAPELAPMTVTMAGGLGLVFVVYFFSSAAGGVDDESLVNRMPLQMVPALVFYLALLLQAPRPVQAPRAARRSSQLHANAAEA